MRITEIIQPSNSSPIPTDSSQSLARIQSVINQRAQDDKKEKPTKTELVMGLIAYSKLKRDAELKQKLNLLRKLRNLEATKNLPPTP